MSYRKLSLSVCPVLACFGVMAASAQQLNSEQIRQIQIDHLHRLHHGEGTERISKPRPTAGRCHRENRRGYRHNHPRRVSGGGGMSKESYGGAVARRDRRGPGRGPHVPRACVQQDVRWLQRARGSYHAHASCPRHASAHASACGHRPRHASACGHCHRHAHTSACGHCHRHAHASACGNNCPSGHDEHGMRREQSERKTHECARAAEWGQKGDN